MGRPKVVFRRDEVAVLRANGLSIRQIARKLGVGMGTVRRVLNAGVGPAEACQKPVPGAL
jgi:transposase